MKSHILIASLAAVVATAAAAQTAPQPLIGISRAVSLAESATAGKAFDAELDHRGVTRIYEVSLVKNGRVLEAEIDAISGQMLGKARTTGLRLPWNTEVRKAAQIAPRSLSQTIAMVEGATKGTVSDIGLEEHGGRHYYEVELVGAQDRDILVDIQTGAITPVLDD